jgi:hypothetical protein
MLVLHPVFGEGIVEDERWGGTQLKVRFRDGLTLWISSSRIRVITKPSIEKLDAFQARRMVEAFRLGIVPSVDVKKFTFGRDEVINGVKERLSALERGDGSAILIEGEYGAGKTHIIEYIKRLAVDMDVGVASCFLDPEEVPPYRPKRVYRELVNSLVYLEEGIEKGFRDLLLSAADKKILSDHIFFGPFLKKLKRTSEEGRSVLWQWAEGDSTKEYALDPRSIHRIKGGQDIPALYDASTAVDFYCNLLCGISVALKGIGKKGLLILLDEAETISRVEQRVYLERGWKFFEGLIGIAQKRKELTQVREEDLHTMIRPVPYIYGNPSIVVVITTTPLYEWSPYKNLKEIADTFITLSPLSTMDITNLVHDLINIYSSAYPEFRINENTQRKLIKDILSHRINGIRNYIKYCVEFLDNKRWSQMK